MAKILFVCKQNACRSQIAAAFARPLFGAENVESCGWAPAKDINPVTFEAMAEVGIDLPAEEPKLIQPRMLDWADRVIVVCGDDDCPVVPGAESWGIADPAGRSLEVFREVRELIRGKVEELARGVAQARD